MATRDLSLARKAGEARDKELSKKAHSQAPAEDHAQDSSAYVKSFVFGGIDGIASIFSVVAGGAGGNLSGSTILILGLSNLAADGLAMGLGDYMSSRAEGHLAKKEREREEWEVENYLEGEKEEMIELYVKRGLPRAKAQIVVEIFAKDPKVFVDIMMVEELGIMPEDGDNAIKEGLTTFFSFLFFGFMTLIPYLVTIRNKNVGGADATFGASCAVTICLFLSLGMFQAKLTRQPIIKGGLAMLGTGSLSAAIGYGIGEFVSRVIGVHE